MNTTNLKIRLANASRPFNKEAAQQFISQSASLASNIHVMHHLEALESKQSLNHLLWLAELNGTYIGWVAVEASFSEDQTGAYLNTALTALYVAENYRHSGVATQLIETAAADTAKLVCKELMYQSFDEFRLYKGEDAEVLDFEVDVEQGANDEHSINEIFSRSITNAIEKQIDDLPYFAHQEVVVI
ncbi:MAG: GNAT family N-acetyltransferase [Venatoribacter sp.]